MVLLLLAKVGVLLFAVFDLSSTKVLPTTTGNDNYEYVDQYKSFGRWNWHPFMSDRIMKKTRLIFVGYYNSEVVNGRFIK